MILDDRGFALLTQRRDNGRWEAPGGVLELHEGITTGLLREVEEETGLQVEPVALTGVYKNMTLGVVALVFKCMILGGRLTETAETRAFKWATADDVRRLTVEAFAVRILDAMRYGGTPAIRQHDGHRLISNDRWSPPFPW